MASKPGNRARPWCWAGPFWWRRRPYSIGKERASEVDRRAAVKCTSGNIHGVEASHHGRRVEMKCYCSVAVCNDKRACRGPVDQQVAGLHGYRVNWLTDFDNEISRLEDDNPTDWAGYRASFSSYCWYYIYKSNEGDD